MGILMYYLSVYLFIFLIIPEGKCVTIVTILIQNILPIFTVKTV